MACSSNVRWVAGNGQSKFRNGDTREIGTIPSSFVSDETPNVFLKTARLSLLVARHPKPLADFWCSYPCNFMFS
jgi:hypothetical protein